MKPRLGRALDQGVAALGALGLRYAVVGGLAVGVWCHPRATRDVDLYAELPPSMRASLRRELESRGFDVPAMEGELSRFGVFRSRLRRERVYLDIFDAVGPLGEAILGRREAVPVGDRELWFASASDLAVLKAFSDRPRDFEDLVALLALPASGLDLPYIQTWARALDLSAGGNEVSQRLERARTEAERRRGAGR